MIEQVEICGEKRRLQSVPRRSGLNGWLVLVVAAGLFAVIFTGHGGTQDGAGGIAVALVLLLGGAAVLQRFFRSRMLVGFDREGLYSPAQGWINWSQVTRLEVRRVGNVVTGRRTVIWLAYRGEGAGVDGGEPGWLPINPGLKQSRTVELSEVLERCWRAAGAAAVSQGAGGAEGLAEGAGVGAGSSAGEVSGEGAGEGAGEVRSEGAGDRSDERSDAAPIVEAPAGAGAQLGDDEQDPLRIAR